MKLTHNFDTIEINDDKIEFYSMVGVSKKENWSLLLENVLTYKSGSQKTVIIPEEIIEFQFSIFDYFNIRNNYSRSSYILCYRKDKRTSTIT